MKKVYLVEFHAVKDEGKSTRRDVWEEVVFIVSHTLPADLKKTLRKLYGFGDDYQFVQLDTHPVDFADLTEAKE